MEHPNPNIYKYFSNEEQKKQFRDMLENDENYEDVENVVSIESIEEEGNHQIENQLIIYKENKILNFFKKIFGFFRRRHTD